MEHLLKYKSVNKRIVMLFKTKEGFIVDYDIEKKNNNPNGWKQTIFAQDFNNENEADIAFNNLIEDLLKGRIK